VAKPPTFATSVVVSSPPHHFNVCLGTGHCNGCGIHNEKFLVGMTSDVIVLSVTATRVHNLYPASHLLTTALLVFT